MAKIDPSWTIKTYPEDLKSKITELLKETETTRNLLDDLDKEIQTAQSIEDFKNIAKRAVGNGNYLRKKLGKLVAGVKNTQSSRFLEIKLECAKSGFDFVSTVAQEDASAFVGPLRSARDIMEAYVVSADNIISICRLNIVDQRQLQSTASVQVEP